MDIDEFLDRELSELSSASGKNSRQDQPENIEAKKPEQMHASLLDGANDTLIGDNIEAAEQAYYQLWHILLQQKLTWNDALYQQLSSLARQFSKVISYSHNDVKNKADRIYYLISRGKELLLEGKREQPFKIYSEVSAINNSIPNVFFEEKIIIQNHIINFYQELKSTTDNELIKRVYSMSQDVNLLLDKTNICIKINDIAGAISNYNKCLEVYTQIPEGFLAYKNSAGMMLLEIYRTLSIYLEITRLQGHLNSEKDLGNKMQALQQSGTQKQHPQQHLQPGIKEPIK